MRPFSKPELNFLNVFNELIGLLASYCLLPLQDSKYDPEMHYTMGWFTVFIFYFSGICNVVSIAVIASYFAYHQCRRNYYLRKGIFKCRRQKAPQPATKSEKDSKVEVVESVVAVAKIQLDTIPESDEENNSAKSEPINHDDDNFSLSKGETQRSR